MSFKLVALALALVSAGCMEKSNKAYMAPYAPEKAVTDGTSDVFDPKVDILFVIDNSSSMSGHQQNLVRNIDLFVSAFLKTSIIDYNIGVVTTDTDNSCSACMGQLVGQYRVVNKNTPNASAVLKQNLVVGISGSGYEKPINATAMALDLNRLVGWNTGFIRKTAALTTIFITDAEDQSGTMNAQQLLNQMFALKNGDKSKVLGYGAIIPTGITNCQRDDNSMTPKRIEEYLNLVPNGGNGKNIVSLCAPDYGQRLAEFALQIVDTISSQIYLSRLPDIKSLHVFYGKDELPKDPRKGWAYDPEMNAVMLGDEIDWAAQPPGSKVEVKYKEARGFQVN